MDGGRIQALDEGLANCGRGETTQGSGIPFLDTDPYALGRDVSVGVCSRLPGRPVETRPVRRCHTPQSECHRPVVSIAWMWAQDATGGDGHRGARWTNFRETAFPVQRYRHRGSIGTRGG